MSITLNGRSFNVSFVGDLDIAWNNPIPGSDLSVSTAGKLDSLSRSYQVRVDRKSAVETQLAQLKWKKTDFEYPGMALDSWSVREDGAFATFSMKFRGLFDNRLPKPLISGSMVSGSVLATKIESVSGIVGVFASDQKQVQYSAPQTNYQYVTRGIPQSPQFSGKMANEANIEILNYSGGDGEFAISEVNIRNPLISYAPVAGKYNLRKVVKTTSFSFVQVGNYCEVEEVSTTILQPYEMAVSLL